MLHGDEVVFYGFTRKQLSDAFDMVKDKENWKMPINWMGKNPGEENLRCVESAIVYFTGGSCYFVKAPAGKIRIVADGYYACIGA